MPRERLNRDRVLQAAVALADRSGIDAVSMRALAQDLGVVPMALYKHVRDKDELLDGMVDVLIDEFEPPDPALDWKAAIRHRLLSARRVVLRHPWARKAIESRTRRTPTVLAYMDSVTGMFRAAGFSADLTHHLMHALGNRIWGFSPELFTDAPEADGSSAPARRGRGPEPDPADYPTIVAIATDARARRPDATGCDEDFEFDFALDLLLDGIERLRRKGWTSPTGSGS